MAQELGPDAATLKDCSIAAPPAMPITEAVVDAGVDLGAATYTWDVDSDVMTWQGDAGPVFGLRDIAGINS